MKRQVLLKKRARDHQFKYVESLLDHVNGRISPGEEKRQSGVDWCHDSIDFWNRTTLEGPDSAAIARSAIGKIEADLVVLSLTPEHSAAYWRQLLELCARFNAEWPNTLRLVFSEIEERIAYCNPRWGGCVGSDHPNCATYDVRASLHIKWPVTIQVTWLPEYFAPPTSKLVGGECFSCLADLNRQLGKMAEDGFTPGGPFGMVESWYAERGALMVWMPAYQIAFRELYEHGRLGDLRTCPVCGHWLLAAHDRQKYCSDRCRWAAANRDTERRKVSNRENRQAKRALGVAKIAAKKRRLAELRAQRLGTRKMPKSAD